MTEPRQAPLGPDDDVDPGEPVLMLAELRQEPTTGFFGAIRRRIQRRHMIADASEFSWRGFTLVAVALVGVFFQLFNERRDEGDQ